MSSREELEQKRRELLAALSKTDAQLAELKEEAAEAPPPPPPVDDDDDDAATRQNAIMGARPPGRGGRSAPRSNRCAMKGIFLRTRGGGSHRRIFSQICFVG